MGCVLALTLSLTSCTLWRLEEENRLLDQVGFVAGEVTDPRGSSEGIVVLLLREVAEGWEVEQIDPLSPNVGTYVFHLQAGAVYSVVAFQDLDGNRVRDADEPWGRLEDPERIQLQAHEWRTEHGFLVERTGEVPPGLEMDCRPHEGRSLDTITLYAGELASLDDARFEPREGRLGMWTPLHAGLEHGVGVFFLEPFDEERVPVLFVHGIGGTPRDHAYLIEHLDRERYQPWVFSYPSGVRLHRAGEALVEILDRLEDQLAFDDLVVVAHSMGGLVSSDFVTDPASTAAPRVRLLVTLSTPWAGHSGTRYGVKWSPFVVPSWIDLHPGSEYLTNLRQPLPEHAQHLLFFGFRMRSFNPVMPYSHDSAVSVASQLDRFFQERADRLSGWNLDHDEILANPAVARELYRDMDMAVEDRPLGPRDDD